MADKLMYIPCDNTQIYPSVDINEWLERFVTQLDEPTIQNAIKVPKAVKPKNKKQQLL